MSDWTGQVALVTGASRGIGRQCALALGQRGAHVVVHYHAQREAAEAVAAEVRALGGQAEVGAADVADPASVEALFKALGARHGRLDILVNNAGITLNQLLARTTEDDWHRVVETNLNGVYRCAKWASKLMLKRRYGRIINLASVVGQRGNPGQTAYAASKSGVIGFTRALAVEVATRGITVNAVSPGLIASDMTDTLDDGQVARLVAQVPMGRLGSGEDVARAVAFLASPEASYITGQTLNVDGGMVMH